MYAVPLGTLKMASVSTKDDERSSRLAALVDCAMRVVAEAGGRFGSDSLHVEGSVGF